MRDIRSIEDWLGLLEAADGPRHLFRPAETVAERGRLLREALALAGRVLGGQAQVIVLRSTGRINLMGMHIDHRGGAVNPIAVKDAFVVAHPRQDDHVRGFNVEKQYAPFEFSMTQEAPAAGVDDWDTWTHAEHEKRKKKGAAGDWSNYVRAPLLYLRFSQPEWRLRGMDLFVAGNIPKAAGLSSSSSLVVATATACRELNRLPLDDMQLVDVCGIGEWYVGTRGGRGDHAAIIFGRLDCISHLGSFPLTVERVPLPAGYSVVLANSLVEAKKTENARGIFNQRVACYELGFALLKARDARVRERAERLRDLTPQRLGCSEADVYRLLKLLPERLERTELASMFGDRDLLERLLRTHADVGAYYLRQAVAYGVSECMRSELALDALKAGDVHRFGELIAVSHEGDRVWRAGRPWQPSLTDGELERLAAACESSDARRAEAARLWRLPGWYAVSCRELDEMVDLARRTEGVAGAGRVGAGLGGAMVALVARGAAGALIERLASGYYRPRGLPVAAEEVRPLGGAEVIEA